VRPERGQKNYSSASRRCEPLTAPDARQPPEIAIRRAIAASGSVNSLQCQAAALSGAVPVGARSAAPAPPAESL